MKFGEWLILLIVSILLGHAISSDLSPARLDPPKPVYVQVHSNGPALDYRIRMAEQRCANGRGGWEHISIFRYTQSNWQTWCYGGQVYSEPGGTAVIP